jgi:hypothetical protein
MITPISDTSKMRMLIHGREFEFLSFCRSVIDLFFGYGWISPPNGPELSCGNEVPQRRNPVRARQVLSNSRWLFRACKIVDGWFRQLERLVSQRQIY